MKIGIVTDTNLLRVTKKDLYEDKPVLINVDFFYEYVEDLKKARKRKEIIYFMPRIIIDELVAQKKIAFEEKYLNFLNTFEGLKYALEGEIPTSNIDSILTKEKDDNSHKYVLIDLNYNEEVFNKLINDSINKNAPFDKTKEGKKTDAGFKDALIWNTVLFSKDIDSCDKFYFMSCDQVFFDNKDYLEMEFKKFHPNVDIKIFYSKPDGSERQKLLQEVINENQLIETDIIKLYNEELLITFINSLEYNYSDKVIYSNGEVSYQLKLIKFNNFTCRDFNVVKVKEVKNNEFEVEVDIFTTKYEIIEEVENINKTPVIGTIKLLFSKNNKSFIFESSTLMNIEFYQSPFSKFLISFSNSLCNSHIHEINSNMTLLMKKIKESVSPLHELTKSIEQSSISKIISQINEMSLEFKNDSINDSIKEEDCELINGERID